MICADFDTFLLAITPPRGARERGGAATTGGEIAETGMMFGGGRGRLAARGEGSGGWLWFDLTIFLSPTDDFQVPQLSAIKCTKSYEET
jgi:hypothetical protein